jgi:hypothetical protein
LKKALRGWIDPGRFLFEVTSTGSSTIVSSERHPGSRALSSISRKARTTSASCSTQQSIGIRNSFRPMGRLSMKSYGFTPLQGPSSFAASESVASFSFVKPGGLTLVTAAIALWNTVYIDRSVQPSPATARALTRSFSNISRHSGGNTSI